MTLLSAQDCSTAVEVGGHKSGGEKRVQKIPKGGIQFPVFRLHFILYKYRARNKTDGQILQ